MIDLKQLSILGEQMDIVEQQKSLMPGDPNAITAQQLYQEIMKRDVEVFQQKFTKVMESQDANHDGVLDRKELSLGAFLDKENGDTSRFLLKNFGNLSQLSDNKNGISSTDVSSFRNLIVAGEDHDRYMKELELKTQNVGCGRALTDAAVFAAAGLAVGTGLVWASRFVPPRYRPLALVAAELTPLVAAGVGFGIGDLADRAEVQQANQDKIDRAGKVITGSPELFTAQRKYEAVMFERLHQFHDRFRQTMRVVDIDKNERMEDHELQMAFATKSGDQNFIGTLLKRYSDLELLSQEPGKPFQHGISHSADYAVSAPYFRRERIDMALIPHGSIIKGAVVGGVLGAGGLGCLSLATKFVPPQYKVGAFIVGGVIGVIGGCAITGELDRWERERKVKEQQDVVRRIRQDL